MQLDSRRCHIGISLALVLLAAPALAEPPLAEPALVEVEVEVEAASDIPEWSPPEPSDEMDRIVLKSGETLYGDFEGLRDRKVYFDSDEFDEVDFNWSKVVSVYLTESHIFRLNDRDVMGTAEMREDVFRVRTSRGEIIEFDRSELISITKGGEFEISYWSGDMGFDFSGSRGNTEQIDLSGRVHLRRETGLTRWISDYRLIYAQIDGDDNPQTHRARSAFDIFITRRFFVTAPAVEYYRDQLQNIETRLSPGAGVGYEFVKNAQVEWDGTIGGAYVYTTFFEGDGAADDFAVVVGTMLDVDITSDIELESRYNVQIMTTDLDKTNHHFEAELSNDIWGSLDLDITFMWDRIEKPVTDDQGDTPKSDDFRLMVGFSASF